MTTRHFMDAAGFYVGAYGDGAVPPEGLIECSAPPDGLARWLDNAWVMPVPTEKEVRAERNRLLTASDWTQVADAPVDQAAWAAYRQALRDLPQQDGFPLNVIWPTTPE